MALRLRRGGACVNARPPAGRAGESRGKIGRGQQGDPGHAAGPFGKRGLTDMTVTEQEPLTSSELKALDAWWRAANYLSIGQIYLLDNPLLTEPLRPEHVKPRLLGHWGTTPGLNIIYAHLNRVIKAGDLNMI